MRRWIAGLFTATSLGGGALYGADKAVNPYDDKGTHYELDIKADIEQGERVEIAKDKAAMTLKGWNDEYAITVTPQIPTVSFGADKDIDRSFKTQADRKLLSKKMEFREGDVTAFIEPKAGTENQFDIDFTLHAKPDTNVFTYKIEGAEEFDFYYQSELTPEQIAEGTTRPENVNGSYAVYHKEKANHREGDTNYATGKAFHIYRPKAIDANGAEVWAELSYKNGLLSVTVPQEWLETAEYPVIVDPTLGYTSLGVTNTNLCSEGSDFSLTLGPSYPFFDETGTLDAISWGLKTSAGTEAVDLFFALYTQDSAALSSHDLLIGLETNNVSINTTSAFYTINAASEAISRDLFILAALCNGEDITTGSTIVYALGDTLPDFRLTHFSEQTGAAGSYATRKAEDPWTEVIGNNNIRFSRYITYTTGAKQTDVFLDDLTWTAPAGVTSADVACWGGGGGGFDDTTTTNGGAGGGGGAFASSTVAVTPGNSYAVTVASSSPENLPTVGKFSKFVGDDKTVLACGGKGATSATANGTGGTTACSTGDVEFAGGAGADAVTTDDTGGGGGGSGGPHATGGAAANGQAAVGGGGGGGNGGAASGQTGGTAGPLGGNGGGGGNAAAGANGFYNLYGGGGGGGGDNGQAGGNGGYPGGGGGGAEGNGGVGAGGQCTITYTIPTSPITFVSKTLGAENDASYSHTVAAGTDKMLAVIIGMQDTNNVTGVTFNGDALTQANNAVGNSYECDIWYLLNPDEVTGTVAISGSLADDFNSTAANFTNVLQTSPVDDIDDGTGTGANPSITATPTTDDQLILGCLASNDGGPATTGTGEITLHNSGFGTDAFSSSYAIQSAAAGQAINWTLSAADWAGSTATFKPNNQGGGGGSPAILEDIIFFD